MDYNKLKTFVAVAELGSITKAATGLRRSQSAISQQLILLEAELELRLLERKSAKIFLSKDGERIYQIAKKQLNLIDEEVSKIKQNISKVEGNIRIGAINDYGNDFCIGSYLGSFCKKHPKIRFHVTFGPSDQIHDELLQNKLDIGVLVFFRQPELFIRRPIDLAWHSLYASKTFLKRYKKINTYKDILEAPLIDYNDGFACISKWFQKNSPTLEPSLKHRLPDITVPNLNIAKQIVFSGFGMAILPDYLVEKEVQSGHCVRLLKTSKSLYAGLDIAVRTNKTVRLCETLFINFVSARASNYPGKRTPESALLY